MDALTTLVLATCTAIYLFIGYSLPTEYGEDE